MASPPPPPPAFPSEETKMMLTYSFVLAGVILQYLQLILGRVCRWCGSWVVHMGAEWACKLSNTVSSIALITMPHEHSTVVWTLHLVVLNNSLVAFDGEDRLTYVWTNINVAVLAGSAVLTISRSDLSGAALWLACALSVAMVCACAYCKISIVKASTCKLNSEEINGYMAEWTAENAEGVEDMKQGYDPNTLVGYRYWVNREQRIALESICMEEESERRKDMCLSFALFQLLLRLYHKIRCSEVGSQKSKDLVFKRLCQEAGFRVIEAELGFLHDHVHGGHVLWTSRDLLVRYRLTVLGRAILMYILIPALYFHMEQGRLRSVHDSAVPVVMALLLLHLVFDLVQIILYYRSDWWMVEYMCLPEIQRRNPFRQMVARMHSFNLCRNDYYWQNSIGQYSLLEENMPARPQAWFGHSGAGKATLPANLKVSIARVLMRSNGVLDGVPSLRRAPDNDDAMTQKIKTLLVWHIATCYCEVAPWWIETTLEQVDDPRKDVAVVLSRYCAYIVAFREELLTGVIRERRAFNQVRDEVKAILRYQYSDLSMFHALDLRLRHPQPHSHNNQTVTDGLNLGYHLYRHFYPHQIWGILENIWVKLILSAVAPQYKHCAYDPTAPYHAKYLAQGGEFVTHLWAMLSNAGIQECRQDWHRPHEELGPRMFLNRLVNDYTHY